MTFKIEQTKLSQLQAGEQARLIGIDDDYSQKAFLQELGFTQNAAIQMIRKAPWGDPLQIRIRDSDFVLRRSDAEAIQIERLP